LLNASCGQSAPDNSGSNLVDQEVVSVTTGPNEKVISNVFWGVNAQMMRGPHWKEPGFIEQVKALNPQIIRYPGGTVASYWDWKTGWLMEGIPIKQNWRSIKKNPITLEDLKWACDQTGATPIYVLNMMNSELEYQMEFLREAHKLGLDVTLIELDNEIYLGQDFYVEQFPTGKDYAQTCDEWIDIIKKEFPEARIALVGHSDRGPNANNIKKYYARGTTWNRDIYQNTAAIDAMTFHQYSGTGLKYLSEKSEKGNRKAYNTTFQDPLSAPKILGIPLASWESSVQSDLTTLPNNTKAWITEYNMFEKEGIVAGTWAHGLYTLLQTLIMSTTDEIELLCYHNLTTSAQFAAIFYNNDGFHKALNKQPTQLFGLTAAGECLALYGACIKESSVIKKLEFKDAPEISTFRGKTYPALHGIKAGNNKALILNLSDKKTVISVREIISGDVEFKMIYAPYNRQIAFPKNVDRMYGKEKLIELMPYCAILISEN